MTRYMRKLLFAAALLAAACTPKTNITSPDGRIAVHFVLDETGIPTYRVDVDGQPFLDPSVIGLLSDDANMDRGFSLASSRTKAVK